MSTCAQTGHFLCYWRFPYDLLIWKYCYYWQIYFLKSYFPTPTVLHDGQFVAPRDKNSSWHFPHILKNFGNPNIYQFRICLTAKKIMPHIDYSVALWAPWNLVEYRRYLWFRTFLYSFGWSTKDCGRTYVSALGVLEIINALNTYLKDLGLKNLKRLAHELLQNGLLLCMKRQLLLRQCNFSTIKSMFQIEF